MPEEAKALEELLPKPRRLLFALFLDGVAWRGATPSRTRTRPHRRGTATSGRGRRAPRRPAGPDVDRRPATRDEVDRRGKLVGGHHRADGSRLGRLEEGPAHPFDRLGRPVRGREVRTRSRRCVLADVGALRTGRPCPARAARHRRGGRGALPARPHAWARDARDARIRRLQPARVHRSRARATAERVPDRRAGAAADGARVVGA